MFVRYLQCICQEFAGGNLLNYPMFATDKTADIRKVLSNINSDAFKFEWLGNDSPAFPCMNRKTLKKLKFVFDAGFIAIAMLNLLLGQWIVAGGMLCVIVLEVFLEWKDRKLKRLEQRRVNLEQALQEMRQWQAVLKSCDSSLICRQCKYFHGRSGVVCAVHPEGCAGNECGDFEGKR